MAAVNLDTSFPPLSSFRWPDREQATSSLSLTYDGPTDTLFVHLFEPNRSGASLAIERGDRDYLYLRADTEALEIVGIQIEEFLNYAVHRDPWLLDLLAVAEFEAVDEDKAAELRVLGGLSTWNQPTRRSLLDAFERLIPEPARGSAEHRA
jgi:hypothetical protein